MFLTDDEDFVRKVTLDGKVLLAGVPASQRPLYEWRAVPSLHPHRARRRAKSTSRTDMAVQSSNA